MKKNLLQLILFALVIGATALLASCGGDGLDTTAPDTAVDTPAADTTAGTSEDTAQDTEADDTTSETENKNIMKVEASYSDKPIEFVENGEVYECLDVGASNYEMVFTASCEGNRMGRVMFKYKAENNTYALSINPKRKSIILYNITPNGEERMGSIDVPLAEEGNMKLKMQVSGSTFRLYSLDDEYDTDPYPILDISLTARTSAKGVAFKGGSVEFKDITLSESTLSYDKNNRYMNPLTGVKSGADPYILSHEGKYYLYSTNAPTQGYKVYVSTDLANWTDEGYCLYAKDVAGKVDGNAGFWAPEVYYYDGQFVMIYTAGERLGIATASSPLGPFKSEGRGLLDDKNKEIDGHLFFDDDGKVYNYFVRSGASNAAGKGNEIYGCEFDMKTLTRKTTPVRLLWPEETWEKVSGYVVEGPFMLKHNGLYYLTYTANGYTSKSYAVGFAVSENPLSGFKKYGNNPVLKRNDAADKYGPGHHSFFTNENGAPFIVYHLHSSAAEVHPRVACIDRYKFQKLEGTAYDVIMIDGPSDTMRELPINVKP